jgi:hypothetical protein
MLLAPIQEVRVRRQPKRLLGEFKVFEVGHFRSLKLCSIGLLFELIRLNCRALYILSAPAARNRFGQSFNIDSMSAMRLSSAAISPASTVM